MAEGDDLKIGKVMLDNINKIKSKIFHIQEIYEEKEKRFMKNIQSLHKKMKIWSILEIFLVILVGISQLSVMKNLLLNKVLF